MIASNHTLWRNLNSGVGFQYGGPLWVISRHCITALRMSALPPIADMLSVGIDVR